MSLNLRQTLRRWTTSTGISGPIHRNTHRAANWQLLGLTTGRGKNDQTNKPNRPIKEILGLPLTSRFRKYLTQL